MVRPSSAAIKKRMKDGLTEGEAEAFGVSRTIHEVQVAAKKAGVPTTFIQFRVAVMKFTIQEAVEWGKAEHPPLHLLNEEEAEKARFKQELEERSWKRKETNLGRSQLRGSAGRGNFTLSSGAPKK